MKKIILIIAVLFTGISSSFAYNYGSTLTAASPETGSGFPSEESAIVNVNGYSSFQFVCRYLNAGFPGTPIGSAFLRSGPYVLKNYNFASGTGGNEVYMGSYYTLEFGITCTYNVVGSVHLYW